MSDVNKIVAAILSMARCPANPGVATVATRIEDYQACLKALNDLGGQDEPAGPLGIPSLSGHPFCELV